MSDLKLRPLGDRVVLEPLDEQATTASGIVLPETAKEKPQKGTVLAVGPGARDKDGNLVPMDVKVGDVVLFARYAGTEFKLSSTRTLLVMRESDLLAILA
ncbi:MAG: co-chaperone GroES [Anaerolineae bacterium]|jgi:chaperonin GroES|nr:co-chaperone GroES [Chloroflexota bacterium]